MFDFLYAVIIFPITQILEFSFTLSQKLFKEAGISVIFIGFTISVLCLPLYHVAEKWQQIERNIQKRLKPKVDKIKKVFKGDERYMILSVYYRQNQYHPIYALRSSLGLLIQVPFFIAAYSYLSNLDVIKNVPFSFIRDLSSPDALLSVKNFTVNLLPFAMTLVNCLAGIIYTRGLIIRDKVQLFGIAGVFLILLYNSPSALVLYWTMNNLFSLLKNIYYQIKYKYKRQLLLGILSFLFILLAFFCMVNYSDNSNAQKLIYVCIFSAVIPWIIYIFNKRFSKETIKKYEMANSPAVFLFSIFLLWFLFGLFIPSQLIVSSPQEFSFIDSYTTPLYFLFITALQVFGLFVFWPACMYLLFSTDIKKYFSMGFLIISFGMIVNVFLFPGNYGIISVNFVYGSSIVHSYTEILFNLLIMFIVIFVSFHMYMHKDKKFILALVSFCIFSLISISAVNIFKINSSFKELSTYYVKEQENRQKIVPIFTLSRTGKNVVIIMLDRAISVFIPYIFDETPELKEKYSGFTFYPNTVSFNGYTSIAAPPVFGGYEYTPEEINKRDTVSLVEKHNQSLIMLPKIFSENSYSVCVTDPPYANYNQKSDLSIFDDYGNIQAYITDSVYTDYWIFEHNLNLPKTSDIIKRNMFWYSLHKGLPVFLREPVYMYGNWCSPVSNNSLRLTINGYAVLDYLPRLIKITSDNINTALIMTNNASHEYSLLQAPGYIPVIAISNYGNTRFAKEPAYHVNAAAINRLADWFEFLKKENVYDNTRIILVSDHGSESNFVTQIGLPFNVDQFNPLLMVKDFNISGELTTDMSFMSNADVPYLSLVDIIENPTNPFTGNDISIEAKNNPLYIAISGSIHITGKNDTQFILNPNLDYYVHDNIFTNENWVRANK